MSVDGRNNNIVSILKKEEGLLINKTYPFQSSKMVGLEGISLMSNPLKKKNHSPPPSIHLEFFE